MIKAFVGILFAGFVSAIILEKVARLDSTAEVLFSFPICVRYGKGLSNHEGKFLRDSGEFERLHSDRSAGISPRYSPFPVLEFRLVNQRSHVSGGEIINARVNVVATTIKRDDADDDSGVTVRDWETVRLVALKKIK